MNSGMKHVSGGSCSTRAGRTTRRCCLDSAITWMWISSSCVHRACIRQAALTRLLGRSVLGHRHHLRRANVSAIAARLRRYDSRISLRAHRHSARLGQQYVRQRRTRCRPGDDARSQPVDQSLLVPQPSLQFVRGLRRCRCKAVATGILLFIRVDEFLKRIYRNTKAT